MSQYSPATNATAARVHGVVAPDWWPRRRQGRARRRPGGRAGACGRRARGLAAPVGLLVEAVDAHGVVRGGALEPVPPVRAPARRRCSGPGRRPAGARRRRPRREEVVVAVAAVAERAAVEDQEALVGERRPRVAPAAALHVVAADREAHAPRGRAARPRRPRSRPSAGPRASRRSAGELQQVARSRRCRCRTAPGSSRRGGAVHARTAGAREPLVVAGGERERRSGARSRARRGTSAGRSGGSASSARGARRRLRTSVEQVARGARPARTRGRSPSRSRSGRRQRRRPAARTARACGGCARR